MGGWVDKKKTHHHHHNDHNLKLTPSKTRKKTLEDHQSINEEDYKNLIKSEKMVTRHSC